MRITSVTSTRIVGTFKFRAESRTTFTFPSSGHQYQLVTVNDSLIATEGQFNLPITDQASETLPDSAGGALGGMLNAHPFFASGAIAYVPKTLPGKFYLVVFNEEYHLIVAINDYNGPGTYNTNTTTTRWFSLSRRMSFVRKDGGYDPFFEDWSTLNGGGPGTITIAVTDARVRGSFTATVAGPPTGVARIKIPIAASFDVTRASL